MTNWARNPYRGQQKDGHCVQRKAVSYSRIEGHTPILLCPIEVLEYGLPFKLL